MSASSYRVVTVFGTRPEAIKMAPVVLQLRRHAPEIETIIVVTGQHRELLDQVLTHFRLVPDYDLNIMTRSQSLTDITTRSLTGLEHLLQSIRPDLVLVHGDTTTTLAAALAAHYQRVNVGHVEAGLRSSCRFSPFPEEINRRMVAVLAGLHFAPTERARTNLIREGVDPSSIYVTGNTAIDALLLTVDKSHEFSSEAVRRVVESGRRVVVADVHRRENLGETMPGIADALASIVDQFDDVELIVSLHPNPGSSGPLLDRLSGEERVTIHEPLPYPEWINLLDRSCLYVGDSGGLQEEAPALGVPVVVLRDVTERPEAVEMGTVVLAGRTRERIVTVCAGLLGDRARYQQMARAVNPYGDGTAAGRTVAAIRFAFGLESHRPADFRVGG